MCLISYGKISQKCLVVAYKVSLLNHTVLCSNVKYHYSKIDNLNHNDFVPQFAIICRVQREEIKDIDIEKIKRLRSAPECNRM